MSNHIDSSGLVRSGFTAQQYVLIIVTFMLGMASAAVFNELVFERSFVSASAVASQHFSESKCAVLSSGVVSEKH